MDDGGIPNDHDSASAFRNFIEQELSNLDEGSNIWSLIPQDVVDAAWQRYLDRLDVQAQTLAIHPYEDVWEEQLSDEHRAIVEVIAHHFTPSGHPYSIGNLSADEWDYLLRFVAVLTLHLETNRRPVLEPADLFPYLGWAPKDAISDEEDDEDSTDRPWSNLPPTHTLPAVSNPVTPRSTGRFEWLDLLLIFVVSGIVWISLCELL